MIVSFKDETTEAIYKGYRPPRFSSELAKKAKIKLQMLAAATDVYDLASPPGNKLKKLLANRKNQWSIRINDQWRICFVWQEGNAHNVEIVDYH